MRPELAHGIPRPVKEQWSGWTTEEHHEIEEVNWDHTNLCNDYHHKTCSEKGRCLDRWSMSEPEARDLFQKCRKVLIQNYRFIRVTKPPPSSSPV